MGKCGGCSENCDYQNGCGDCGKTLALTPEEVELLRELGQYSFLPVARRVDDMVPVYLEQGAEKREQMSLVLQCLEKKLLIDITYDPLPGADMRAYQGYPVHGSMALTARGQRVLELLEVQGVTE